MEKTSIKVSHLIFSNNLWNKICARKGESFDLELGPMPESISHFIEIIESVWPGLSSSASKERLWCDYNHHFMKESDFWIYEIDGSWIDKGALFIEDSEDIRARTLADRLFELKSPVILVKIDDDDGEWRFYLYHHLLSTVDGKDVPPYASYEEGYDETPAVIEGFERFDLVWGALPPK